MPAIHKIDTDSKVITTTWHGAAEDSALIDALSKYEHEIKSRPEYVLYNEILDFSKTTGIELTTTGIHRLAEIAVKNDVQSVRTKLAIIVTSPVAYGLARMYQTYRGFVPSASKEVRIFKNHGDALAWINNEEGKG